LAFVGRSNILWNSTLVTDPTITATLAAPIPAVTPKVRRSRRETLLLLAAISVGWKVIVFTLGAALPGWLVTDGLDELPATHRAYGAASMATARALWNTPIERLGGVVRQVRVVSVDSVHTSVASQTGRARTACTGLGARVRAYTYFAIPYSEVRTTCDHGVVEYRVLRSRPRSD
jgi:hypothetical protein